MKTRLALAVLAAAFCAPAMAAGEHDAHGAMAPALKTPAEARMVGGMISSTVLTLAVIPAIYALVKQWRIKHGMEK